jgi:NAD(P)-dependent dehydrogenase (short-subunit alcohol dehydrogenase family)
MNSPFSISGKKIFITGASSGIGRCIAIECSKLGAKLIITGRDRTRLQETFNALDGDEHVQIIANLSESADISRLVTEVPLVDGVVHSAGITKILPFQFLKEEDINAVMKVNFVAPTIITQLLLKSKKLNKGASIVIISSISGVYCSSVAESIYSASKGALNGIVKAMAIEFAIKSIRVNSVNPGIIQTPFFSNGPITDEQLSEGVKKYPLKRYGKPEDVAYAAIYLLSDAAAWVTGSNLLVDGGYTLL